VIGHSLIEKRFCDLEVFCNGRYEGIALRSGYLFCGLIYNIINGRRNGVSIEIADMMREIDVDSMY
jgi:hypothetical protein